MRNGANNKNDVFFSSFLSKARIFKDFLKQSVVITKIKVSQLAKNKEGPY